MTALEGALDACGGASAPATATAQLRQVLAAALRHGREELGKSRSGYGDPVEIGIGHQNGHLLAATPVGAALRADPQVASVREQLLAAAVVGALVLAAGLPVLGRAVRAENLRTE
jgi:hypothetical protein